jgi:hypothetical protein
MIVVEVDDHRGEQQPLLAAGLRTAANGAFQAVEQAVESLGPNQPDFVGQAVHSLVGRAQGTGGASSHEIVAVGLFGATPHSTPDRIGQVVLAGDDSVGRSIGADLRPRVHHGRNSSLTM